MECYPEPNEQMECKCYFNDPFLARVHFFYLSHTHGELFVLSKFCRFNRDTFSTYEHTLKYIDRHALAPAHTHTHIETKLLLDSPKLVFKSLSFRMCAHFVTVVCWPWSEWWRMAWDGRAKVSDFQSDSFDYWDKHCICCALGRSFFLSFSLPSLAQNNKIGEFIAYTHKLN